MANMSFGVNILPKPNTNVTLGNSDNPWTIVTPNIIGETIGTSSFIIKNNRVNTQLSNNNLITDTSSYFTFRDTNGTTGGCELYYTITGNISIGLFARNYNTTANEYYSWHGISMCIDKDDTVTYSISAPAAFRSAISAAADSAVVHLADSEVISGDKIFTGASLVQRLTSVDLSETNNGVTSQAEKNFALEDSAGRKFAFHGGLAKPDGTVVASIGVKNYLTNTSAMSDWQGIIIKMDKTGTVSYSVASPAAFRTAIGVGASGTHADTYFVTSGTNINGQLASYSGIYQHWGVSGVVQPHATGTKAYQGKRTALIVTDTGLYCWNATDKQGIWTLDYNHTHDYLSLTGGTLTGNLALKHNTINLKSATNGVTDSTGYYYYARDKNDYNYAVFEGVAQSSGKVVAWMGVQNRDTSGNAKGWGGLGVYSDKEGNITYSVTNQSTFRTAIGVGASGTHADSYFLQSTGGTLTGILTLDYTGATKASYTIYNAITLKYKNSDNGATYTVQPLRYMGTPETGTTANNAIILMGSSSGSTWVYAGEDATNLPARLQVANNEELFLSSDNTIHFYYKAISSAPYYTRKMEFTSYGLEIFNPDINLTDASNNVSTTTNVAGVYFKDNASQSAARLLSHVFPSANSAGALSRLYLQAQNYNGTTATGYKGIIISVSKSGVCTYEVNTPENFRSAIGAGTSSLAIGTTSSTAMAGNTNVTNVQQNASTSAKWRKILLGTTEYAAYNTAITATSGVAYEAASVSVQPSTGTIKALAFIGPLTGNVTGNCSGSSGSCTGLAAKATGDADGNAIKTTYLKLSGGTMTGAITRTITTKTAFSGMIIENTESTITHKTSFYNSATGNQGIYDHTNSKWIIYTTPAGSICTGTITSGTWNGNTIGIAYGGTGATGSSSTTTIADIATAASGCTISEAQYAVWGKVATVRLVVTKTAATTTETNIALATLVSGKRPKVQAYGGWAYNKTCWISTGGIIYVRGTNSANASFVVGATFVLT